MARMPLRRALAAGLAAVLFAQDVALIHAAQTSLWEERRARQGSRPSDAGAVASLPAPAANIRAVLDATAASRRSLEAGDRKPSTLDRRSPLAAALASVPPAAASLRRVVKARNRKAAGAVVLIQDVHLNVEAQENIARALDALSRSPAAPLAVGVEGAFGPFSFDRLAGLPDAELVRALARHYLVSGLIAAPTYAGMTAKAAATFHGVDDAELHRRNVEAYRASRVLQPRAKAALAEARRALSGRRAQELSKDLRAFDDLRSAHRSGAMSLGPYVERLTGRYADGKAPPALRTFIEAYRLERGMDFNAVERERRRLIEKIVAGAAPGELKSLLDDSLRYRSGDISYADFYRSLKVLAARKGVSMDETPALAGYVRYVELADAVRAEDLFEAIAAVEKRVVNRLAVTAADRDIIDRSDALYLTERLIAFSLTPEEWHALETLKRASPLDPAVAGPFESFYREADRRSEKIVENLAAMESPGTGRVRGLVAGGFHTPDIAAKLAERGFDVAILQPALTKIDGLAGTEYLSIFSREKAPLERLLAGERLFLAPAELAAGDQRNPEALAKETRLAHFGLASAAVRNLIGRFPAGANRVETVGNARVITTEAAGTTAVSTPDAVPSGYRTVDSGVPAPAPATGLASLTFLTRASAAAAVQNLWTRVTALPDTQAIGRRYFAWLGSLQAGFTTYVLAPAIESFAVFNPRFVSAHRGSAEQQARRSRGAEATIRWARWGAMAGAAAALLAAAVVAPDLTPRTFAGVGVALSAASVIVTAASALALVAFSAGRHFTYTLFNPDAALTLSLTDDPYVLNREGHDAHLRSVQVTQQLISPSSPDYERFRQVYDETREVFDALLRAAGLDPAEYQLYLRDMENPGAEALKNYPAVLLNLGVFRMLSAGKSLNKDTVAFLLAREVAQIVRLRKELDSQRARPAERRARDVQLYIRSGQRTVKGGELESDLGALQLMDAAGFNVAQAPVFYRELIAFRNARGLQDEENFFDFVPEYAERERRLQSRILSRHWRNYLAEAKTFSQAAAVQSAKRTFVRELQDKAARVRTVRQLADALRLARTLGELHFAYFAGLHALYENASADLTQAREALRPFVEALAPTPAERVLSDFVVSEVEDTLNPKISEARTTAGASRAASLGAAELLAALEAGVPEFYSHEVDFDGANPALAKTREALINQYQSTEKNGYRGARFGAYLRGFVGESIRRLEEDIRTGQLSQKDAMAVIRAVRKIHMQVTVSPRHSDWNDTEGMVRTILWAYTMNADMVRQTGADDLREILSLLEAGFQPVAGDYTRFKFDSWDEQWENQEFVTYNLRENVSPSVRPVLEEWMSRNADVQLGMDYDLRTPAFRAAGAQVHLDYFRTYLERVTHTYYGRRVLAKFSEFVPDQELDALIRLGLSFTEQKRQAEDMDVLDLFAKRFDKGDKIFQGDVFESSLMGRLEGELRERVRNASAPTKALVYVLVFGGVPFETNLRKFVFSRIPPAEASIVADVIRSREAQIAEGYKSLLVENRSQPMARYALPVFLQALFVELGVADRLLSSDVDDSGPTRWEPFDGEIGTGSLYGGAFNARPNRVQRVTPGVNKFRPADVVALFDFVDALPADFDAAAALLGDRLPEGAFRSFAVYVLWVRRVAEVELGRAVDADVMFDINAMQNELAGLDPAQRARANAALKRVMPLFAGDPSVEIANATQARKVLSRDAKPVNEAPLRDEHAAEFPSYDDGLYTTFGGSISQMNVFVSRLFENDLAPIASGAAPLEDKVAAITAAFPVISPERDRWLRMALDNLSPADGAAAQIAAINLIESTTMRDAYALPAIERAWDGEPALFSTLDRALETVRAFFPDGTSMRDDVLNEVAQQLATTPAEYQKVYELFSNPFENPELLREDGSRRNEVAIEIVRMMIGRETAEDKAEFLLWLFEPAGAANPRAKPYSLVQAEHMFRLNFDGIKALLSTPPSKRFPDAGRTGQQEFLSPLLSGRDNVFSDPQARATFLDGLFDLLIPRSSVNRDLLKVTYDAVFEYADPYRREQIILNLVGAVSNLKDENGRDLSPDVQEARSTRLLLEAVGLVGTKISQIFARSPSTPAAQREEYAKSESSARLFYKGVVFDLVEKLYEGGFEENFIAIAEPLGSASIKGVYRAQRKSDGRWIALKVKRPDVEKRINEDLAFLRQVLSAIRPALAARSIAIPSRLLQQVEEIFREELDFKQEAANAGQLRLNLAGAGFFARVRQALSPRGVFNFLAGRVLYRLFPNGTRRSYTFTVPEIYDVINNTIITEELVSGVPLSRPDKVAEAGHDAADLRNRAAREFLRQLFIDGFYHADPKVGHVIVDGSRIFLIDAGASSALSRESGAWLRGLVAALNANDEAALRAIVAASNAALDRKSEQMLRDRVLDSTESTASRAMWFFQVLEDGNAEIRTDLWAVFRFLAAGGSLFEPQRAPGPTSLILPGTFNAILNFFNSSRLFGRAAEWKVAVIAAFAEVFRSYTRSFLANHPSFAQSQRRARALGLGLIYLGSLAGAAAFVAAAGLDVETGWQALGLISGAVAFGLAGNITTHAGWDLSLLALGRPILTPEQRTALGLVRARSSLSEADQELVDAVVAAMPEIANLGVTEGLDLRSEAGRFLAAELRRGRSPADVVPAMLQLSRTSPDALSSYDAAARPADGADGATVNLLVTPSDATTSELEAAARREIRRREQAGSRDTVVFAVSGDEAQVAAALALNGSLGEAVRFVRNDDSLVFEPGAIESRLGIEKLSKINVFVAKNAALSPAAFESLQALERLNPRLASIYLLIESATRVAMPVTTQQLGEMLQLKRLIETQA